MQVASPGLNSGFSSETDPEGLPFEIPDVSDGSSVEGPFGYEVNTKLSYGTKTHIS